MDDLPTPESPRRTSLKIKEGLLPSLLGGCALVTILVAIIIAEIFTPAYYLTRLL
jgi:hypothetical protein